VERSDKAMVVVDTLEPPYHAVITRSLQEKHAILPWRFEACR